MVVWRAWVLAVGLIAAAGRPAAAEVYEVGDGMAYAAIGDVPWEALMPGDVVRIHWRAEPYREKWVIGRRGTEAQPIVVQGVRGPGGERPVIDGRDATTRAALDYTNGRRGVIKIGSSSAPPDVLPAWIVIEGLDVRSARPPYAFTDADGVADSYAANAAAIYIEKGEDIVIRDCAMSDAGNGLFIGAFDGQTQRIRIADNEIFDNGNVDSIYEHNSYTAAIDLVFEGNHYGPLRDGCLGNNLKDRSAGLVVRYNWIEGGNRQLDLVDAEDSAVLVAHPSYGDTFVYGNVLVEREGDGNSQIVHYGGDSGTVADYRKGTLHLHHNTVVSTRDGNTTLLRLSTNDESADVRNNIVYVTADGSRLALFAGDGTVDLRTNWMSPAWVPSHDVVSGVINDDGSGLDGMAPGFVDAAAQNFHLVDTAPCRDAAIAVAAHAPVRQYVRHAGTEPRPDDGAPDVGAFEYCDPGSCAVEDPDAGPGGPDGGGGGGGGGGGSGGGGGAGGSSPDTGCGCAAAPRGPSAMWALLGLIALWQCAGFRGRPMGRIFETRKATMFARWNKMSKAFTRIAKELTMAAKSGGPDPTGNPNLRRAIQNARAVNMPKDKIESAIKRATSKDTADYQELIYEGYAPHGVAVLVVAATDNPTRTVANVRVCFNKGHGNMGNSGSVSFGFNRMGVFRLNPEGLDLGELELELIDHGLEEMGESTGEKGEPQVVIRCPLTSFGDMQSAIEARGITPIESVTEFIPTTTVELPEDKATEVLKLIDLLEQDDDVQHVFHNLA